MWERRVEPAGDRCAEISNLVAGLVSRRTGRGPTKAKTYLELDLVTVVLEDALTKGEQHLVASGMQDVVLDLRRAFQLSMRAELTAGVERITGRRVVAFLCDNHLAPDVSISSFVLGSGRPGDVAAAAQTPGDRANPRPQPLPP